MLSGAGRVIDRVGQRRQPAPAATAMARSRTRCQRIAPARVAAAPISSRRFGSQRRPSRSSTVVTISTSKLRQREIGRGEPDEGDAGDEAGAAEQDERGEPVELGLLGGADRAGDADRPDQREGEIEIAVRRAARARARARRAAPGPATSAAARQQPQLRLQAPRAEDASPAIAPAARTATTSTRSKMRWPLRRRSRGGPSTPLSR